MSTSHRVCEICDLHEARLQNRVPFFSFPLDGPRCRQWLRAVGKEALLALPIKKLSKRYVCSRHFEFFASSKEYFRLLKYAVPVKNLASPPLSYEQLEQWSSHNSDIFPAVPTVPTTSKKTLLLSKNKQSLPSAIHDHTYFYRSDAALASYLNTKCAKCGVSGGDSNVYLYRFPKPGITNQKRCAKWAKYCYPDEKWYCPVFQMTLFANKLMLCSRHFIAEDIHKTLPPYAVPGDYGEEDTTVSTQALLSNKTRIESTCKSISEDQTQSKSNPLSNEGINRAILETANETVTDQVVKIQGSHGQPNYLLKNYGKSRPDANIALKHKLASTGDELNISGKEIQNTVAKRLKSHGTLKILDEPYSRPTTGLKGNIINKNYGKSHPYATKRCKYKVVSADSQINVTHEMEGTVGTETIIHKNEMLNVDEKLIKETEDLISYDIPSDNALDDSPCPSPEVVEERRDPSPLPPVPCDSCSDIITGYRFSCVSCIGRVLCGGCAVHGAHSACYVLRVRPGRPLSEVHAVLQAVRTTLDMATFADDLAEPNPLDDTDVDVDIKSETTDSADSDLEEVFRAYQMDDTKPSETTSLLQTQHKDEQPSAADVCMEVDTLEEDPLQTPVSPARTHTTPAPEKICSPNRLALPELLEAPSIIQTATAKHGSQIIPTFTVQPNNSKPIYHKYMKNMTKQRGSQGPCIIQTATTKNGSQVIPTVQPKSIYNKYMKSMTKQRGSQGPSIIQTATTKNGSQVIPTVMLKSIYNKYMKSMTKQRGSQGPSFIQTATTKNGSQVIPTVQPKSIYNKYMKNMTKQRMALKFANDSPPTFTLLTEPSLSGTEVTVLNSNKQNDTEIEYLDEDLFEDLPSNCEQEITSNNKVEVISTETRGLELETRSSNKVPMSDEKSIEDIVSESVSQYLQHQKDLPKIDKSKKSNSKTVSNETKQNETDACDIEKHSNLTRKRDNQNDNVDSMIAPHWLSKNRVKKPKIGPKSSPGKLVVKFDKTHEKAASVIQDLQNNLEHNVPRVVLSDFLINGKLGTRMCEIHTYFKSQNK